MAVPDDDNAISFYFRNSSTVSSLIELLILRTSLSKNQTSWEMKISTPLQILHAVRHSEGMHKNALFEDRSALVAMVTTAACSRPGASFSCKNVAKKSEMFISLSQAKCNITNWHFYHT